MDELEKRTLELDVVYTGGSAVETAIADLRRYANEWSRVQGLTSQGISSGRIGSSGSPSPPSGGGSSSGGGGSSSGGGGSSSGGGGRKVVDDEAAGRARMHASAMRWAKIEWDEQQRQARERVAREAAESRGRAQFYSQEKREFDRNESAKQRETRQREAAESRGRAQFYSQEQREFNQRMARESAGRRAYYAEEERLFRRQISEEEREYRRVQQDRARRAQALQSGALGIVGGGQQMAAGASRMLSAATGFIAFLERSAAMALSVAGTIENLFVTALQHVERAALISTAAVTALGAATAHAGIEFNRLKENTMLALETLTKSGEKAQKVFDFAFKLAIPAKFTFEEVLTGAKTLESFGLKLDNYGQQTGRYLRAAVALAQGMNKPLEQTTRYLGSVAQGRALLQQSAALGLGPNVVAKYGIEYDSRNSPKDRKALLEANVRAIEDIWGGFIEKMADSYDAKLDSMISYTHVFAGKISEGLYNNLKPSFGKVADMMQNLLDPGVGSGKDRITASAIKERIESMRENIADMRSQGNDSKDPADRKMIAVGIKEEEKNLRALNEQYVILVKQLGPVYALVEGLSVPFTLLGKAISGATDHLPEFVNWLGKIITKENVVNVISEVVTLIRVMGKDIYDFLQKASGGQGLAGIWVTFRDAAKGAIEWVVVRFEAFLAVLDYLRKNGKSVWDGLQKGLDKIVEVVEVLVGLQVDNFFLKMVSGAATIGLGFATAAASAIKFLQALGLATPAAGAAADAALGTATANAAAAGAAANGTAAGLGGATAVGVSGAVAAGVAGGATVAAVAGTVWDAAKGKGFVSPGAAAGEMGLNPLYNPDQESKRESDRIRLDHARKVGQAIADRRQNYAPGHDTSHTIDDIHGPHSGPLDPEHWKQMFQSWRDKQKWIPDWLKPQFLGENALGTGGATPDQLKSLRGRGVDSPGPMGTVGDSGQVRAAGNGVGSAAWNQARDAGKAFLGWGAGSVHDAVPKDAQGLNMADEAGRIWNERVAQGEARNAAGNARQRVSEERARTRAQVNGILNAEDPNQPKVDPDIAPSVFIAAHGLYNKREMSDRDPAVLDKILQARKYRAGAAGKEEGPEDLLGSIPLLRERQRGERAEVVKAMEERDRRGEAGSEHAGELIDNRGEVKSAEEQNKDQEHYWQAVGKFWKTESEINKISKDAMEMRSNTVIETSKAYEAAMRAQLSTLSKSEQQVAGEQMLIPAMRQRKQAIVQKMQQVGITEIERLKLQEQYYQEEKGIQDVQQHATDEQEKRAFTLPKKQFETLHRLIRHMPNGRQRGAIQQMLLPRLQSLMAGANAETDPDKREEKQLEVMDLIGEMQGELKASDPFHGAFDREQAQQRHGAMQRGRRGRGGRPLPQGNQGRIYHDMSPFGIAQRMGAIPGISLGDQSWLSGQGGGAGGMGPNMAPPTYNQMIFNFPANATPDQMKEIVNQQIENLYRKSFGQGARR